MASSYLEIFFAVTLENDGQVGAHCIVGCGIFLQK